MASGLCKPIDGKVRCGHNRCIVLSKVTKIPSVATQMKSTEFFGPSMTTFVGHYGHPNVFVGPMGIIEPKDNITDPGSWFGMAS